MLFKRPDFEIKNAEWQITLKEGKFTIKHRKKGIELKDLTLKDIKSLSTLIASTVTATIQGGS